MSKGLWIIISIFTFSASVSAQVELDPRSFLYTGPCTAQGEWTRQAMEAANRIRSFTQQLKDSPECRSLGQVTSQILNETDVLNRETAFEQSKDSQSIRLSKEHVALRTVVDESPMIRDQVLKTLFKNNIDAAKENLKNGDLVAEILEDPSQANAKMSRRERVKGSISMAISYADRLVDNLPLASQCVLSPNAFGNYFSAVSNILASYAASGQDGIGTKLSSTVQKLSQYLNRDQKFAETIRQLNEIDLRQSMQCLLEVTSETYCSAYDAHKIFDQVMGTHEVTEDKVRALKLEEKMNAFNRVKSPLGGYYILNQHVPNITSWLMKVQIGVTPNLPTEAQFQKEILDNVISFFKSMKDLQAHYRRQKLLIESYTEFKQRQNAALELVVGLATYIARGGDGLNTTNFYTQSVGQPMHIAFKLLNMDTPKEVTGQGEGGNVQFMQDWTQYLQANYEKLPQFQDPMKLVEDIGPRMEAMIAKAEAAATIYYNRFFIVDKVGIVNDSFIGMNFSVRESLYAVYLYLTQLKERLISYNNDLSQLGAIEDTIQRILIVLKRYENIKKLGEEVARDKSLSTQEIQRQTDLLNTKLIEEVYKQFQVLLARTGWLQNRMVSFVQYDYIMMVRNQVSLDPYLKDFYRSLGVQAIIQTMDIAGKNPSLTSADLSMALSNNKKNLKALENLFADRLSQEIARLKLSATHNKVDSVTIMKDNMVRSFHDGYDMNIDENTSKPLRFIRGIMNHLHEMMLPIGGKTDRYTDVSIWDQLVQPVKKLFGAADRQEPVDTEMGSARKLYSQLCTQALAFDNLRPFWYSCKDANLLSPFPAPSSDPELTKKFNDYASVNFATKAWEGIDSKSTPVDRDLRENHSKRICAFRDFNRRNLVLYLTRGAQQMLDKEELDLSNIILDDRVMDTNFDIPSGKSGVGQ